MLFNNNIARRFKKLLRAPFDQGSRHTVGRRLNTYYHSRAGLRNSNPNGIDIFDQDWDNLVILDACRYDEFAAAKGRHGIPGELKKRPSKASQTPEWLKSNFDGRQLHDVVYVTGTAMPYHLALTDPADPSQRQQKYGFDLDVHDLINVWADPPEESVPVYDEGREQDRIILPEAMCSKALEVSEEYPHKRLIIHIGPPHDPYLGPTGERLHQRAAHPWNAFMRGDLDVDVDDLRQAYIENVDIAVSAVVELIDKLPGKTVISSDHGDLLWERSSPIPIKDFLHPEQTYVQELITVPWNVTVNGTKETHPDPPVDYESRIGGGREAEDQLRALGYL